MQQAAKVLVRLLSPSVQAKGLHPLCDHNEAKFMESEGYQYYMMGGTGLRLAVFGRPWSGTSGVKALLTASSTRSTTSL